MDKDIYQGVAAGRALRLKQYGDGVLFPAAMRIFHIGGVILILIPTMRQLKAALYTTALSGTV